jgi:hypothetical protein
MSVPPQELIQWFGSVSDDPEIRAWRQRIIEALWTTATPRTRQRLVDKHGPQPDLDALLSEHLVAARSALRRVLVFRKLAPSAHDDARIEACEHLATLERWLDQAVTAATTAGALT